MSRPAVIVMMKAPRPGFAKTRLSPPISAEEAAALAARFALDTVRKLWRVTDDVIIAYAPADGQAELKELLGEGLHWMGQTGADLGERLDAVTRRAFAAGFGPLITTGTDSPTLPESIVAEALDSLAADDSRVALGPTDDGGFYLVGTARHAPGIFDNVAWSTSLAYEHVARNAALSGLNLIDLPHWYDVDTFTDLSRLRSEFFSNEEARRAAPLTHQWIVAHDESLFPVRANSFDA